MSDSWDHVDCSPPGSFFPWDFPGENTGVGCHSLFQGIFPGQGSNSCLLHWQVGSLPLSRQGSPCIVVCLCWSQTPNYHSLPHLSLWQPFTSFLYLWVCFCFINKFTCIIFLGFTFKWYHIILVSLWLTSVW